MPSLGHILERSQTLSASQREWLHQLVGDWQLISDFSFADLVLVTPLQDERFIIAAACRPATNATALDNDVVNMTFDPADSEKFREIIATGQRGTVYIHGLRYEGYPVRRAGEDPFAVLALVYSQRSRKETVLRHSSYEEIEEQLLDMVTQGLFPMEGTPSGFRHGAPRVTDGFTHIDADGAVIFNSPNAVSNLHRLGIRSTFEGQLLAEQITSSIDAETRLDDALPVVLLGRAPWMTELELRGAVLSLRAVPLWKDGKHVGAVVLSRDISELRRRELELVSKDTTIREINHRVKNNLQTVSALLRMQARRADDKKAIEVLSEAQRRVETIALVHQILSQTVDEIVDFSEVLTPLITMATDIASTDVRVSSEVRGEFGMVDANTATRLAVVLNELVSNAVEHGLPHGGHIVVSADREGDVLTVQVSDDGVGVPTTGVKQGLGTRIVRTMVEGELHGTIKWEARDGGGTTVTLTINVTAGLPPTDEK